MYLFHVENELHSSFPNTEIACASWFPFPNTEIAKYSLQLPYNVLTKQLAAKCLWSWGY